MLRRITRPLRTPLGLAAATLALIASTSAASRHHGFRDPATLIGRVIHKSPPPEFIEPPPSHTCGPIRTQTSDVLLFIFGYPSSIKVYLSTPSGSIAQQLGDALRRSASDPHTTKILIGVRNTTRPGYGFVVPWYDTIATRYELEGASSRGSPPQSEVLEHALPEIKQALVSNGINPQGLDFSAPTGHARSIRLLPTNIALDLLTLCLAAAILTASLTSVSARLAKRRRLAKNLCPACGYDWSATQGPCPECNALRRSPEQAQPTSARSPTRS